MNKSVLILFLAVFFSACEAPPKIERGFYHWKSDFSISTNQVQFLNKLNTELLYIHFFDVVMAEGEAVPVAEIENYYSTEFSVVPVVYITTDVFKESSDQEIESLAEKVYTKIVSIKGDEKFSEIQIDCDWMPSIQEKYFKFLSLFKAEMKEDADLSATVRLYQYKYPDIAGVPPVDRGLLMYYNMGDLTAYQESNSILNNDLGKQYLTEKKYPLPLDIALPNFSWSLLFRQGEFQQICPEFSEDQLKNDQLFVSDRPNHYIFTSDTVLYGTYFRYGDELRYEKCSTEELKEAANLLSERVKYEDCKVLIYHLQDKTIKDYEKLHAVFTAFE